MSDDTDDLEPRWPDSSMHPALRQWWLEKLRVVGLSGDDLAIRVREWYRQSLDNPLKVELDEDLEPTDCGIDGAIPLPKARWDVPVLLTDTQWSDLNRRANALLMGRIKEA